jgi:hypothetical protein
MELELHLKFPYTSSIILVCRTNFFCNMLYISQCLNIMDCSWSCTILQRIISIICTWHPKQIETIVSQKTVQDDFFTHNLYHADCVRPDIPHTFFRKLLMGEISNAVNFINFYPSGLSQIYNFL